MLQFYMSHCFLLHHLIFALRTSEKALSGELVHGLLCPSLLPGEASDLHLQSSPSKCGGNKRQGPAQSDSSSASGRPQWPIGPEEQPQLSMLNALNVLTGVY